MDKMNISKKVKNLDKDMLKKWDMLKEKVVNI